MPRAPVGAENMHKMSINLSSSSALHEVEQLLGLILCQRSYSVSCSGYMQRTVREA